MNNLREFGVVELHLSEKKEVDGGWFWIIPAVGIYYRPVP